MRRAPFALLCLVALVACGGEFDAKTTVECPSFDDFKPVSTVLEKRCGTTDCHGSISRPLKLYGQLGLRHYDNLACPLQNEGCNADLVTEGLFSGGDATTEREYEENWRSVCGLEPERTNKVARGELQPRDLMLLRKPLLIEHHKGGQLLLKGGPADVCIESWLRGESNIVECKLALEVP